MSSARFTGNLFLAKGSVINDTIASNTEIDSSKLQHRYKALADFGLAIGDTPVTEERIVFVADADATIQKFDCLLNDSGTSTDIDFDLKINGTTALSSAVNYVHGDGDGTVKSGSLSTASLSVGDIVSISMTVTSATGAKGPVAWVTIDESPAT